MEEVSACRRLVLFGAGVAGRQVLAELDAKAQVIAVLDNDAAKWGTAICGHVVMNPEMLTSLHFDKVLIASTYYVEIEQQLRMYGVTAARIETTDGQVAIAAGKALDEPMLSSIQMSRRSYPSAPLRVAYVLDEFPVLSQSFVRDEIDAMELLGVEVKVFARRAPATATAGKSSRLVEYVGGDMVMLLESVANFGADLIHTHFVEPHVRSTILPLCERLRLPFVCKPHAYDIFRNDFEATGNLLAVTRNPWCRAVLAIGHFHLHFLARKGVPPEQLYLLRNVVDLKPFREMAQHVPRLKVRKLLSVARHVEKKGLDLLIAAFRALPDSGLTLQIMGYGPITESLKSLANGDSRIIIDEAPSSASQIAAALSDADLFVLPCRIDKRGDSDGLPTVLLEALATGVPVVASSVASTPDLVRHRETGWLSVPGSLPSLKMVLEEAVYSDLGVRQSMLNRAQFLLEDEFSPERAAKDLLAIWQRCIATRF